jgi:hypothetical protein
VAEIIVIGFVDFSFAGCALIAATMLKSRPTAMLRRTEGTLFLRASGCVLYKNNPYKVRENKPNQNSPFETAGNMATSFEKIIEQAHKKAVFPITDNMYDRPGVQPYTTNPADADKMPNKGKVGAPKTSSGSGASMMRETDNMVDTTKLTKSQLPWERVYAAEEVKMSKLTAEYYYEEEMSPEAKKASLHRQIGIGVLVSSFLFTMYLVTLVSDPELSGQSVGNQSPTFGVPYQAPPGYEIVRLDRKTGLPIEERFRPASEADQPKHA